MAKIEYSTVLSSTIKLKSQLKPNDQRFNKETKMFEYWDGTAWVASANGGTGGGSVDGDYVTREEFAQHKVDPKGHTVATTTQAGFIDGLSVVKLKEVETNLSPDPSDILNSILDG